MPPIASIRSAIALPRAWSCAGSVGRTCTIAPPLISSTRITVSAWTIGQNPRDPGPPCSPLLISPPRGFPLRSCACACVTILCCALISGAVIVSTTSAAVICIFVVELSAPLGQFNMPCTRLPSSALVIGGAFAGGGGSVAEEQPTTHSTTAATLDKVDMPADVATAMPPEEPAALCLFVWLLLCFCSGVCVACL